VIQPGGPGRRLPISLHRFWLGQRDLSDRATRCDHQHDAERLGVRAELPLL